MFKMFKIMSLTFVLLICSTIISLTPILNSKLGLVLVVATAIPAIVVFTTAMLIEWKKLFQYNLIIQILRSIKCWTAIVLLLSIFAISCQFSMDYPKDGITVMHDSSYYIQNHGEMIREISESQYNSYLQAFRYKLLSGAFLFFSLGQLLLMKSKNM